MTGEQLLDKACQKAWEYQFLTYPNPSVGALISDKNGQIIASQAHQEAGEAHAELLACKLAYECLSQEKIPSTDPFVITEFLLEHHGGIFNNLDIYVTLEPCAHIGKTPSCAFLLENLSFDRVYIGVCDPHPLASGGIQRLKNVTVLNHKGSQDLLYPFLKWQKNHFVFFKIALNHNDTYDTGIISNADSRKLVHQFRQKIDLLCIGGESVRSDRPRLDTRLVEGNSVPDVLIFSKNRTFDTTIPLFGISDREVIFSNRLQIPKDKKFIMIEGGARLFEKVQHLCDWLVVFQSPHSKDGKMFTFPKDARLLHQRDIQTDTLKIYSLSSNLDEIQLT